MEESEIPGAYKPSSDENNHHTDEDAMIKEAEGSTKRSYECVYCKMGFTNAQALGGHMNIHRKDRANHSAPSSSLPSGPIPVSISTSFTSSRSHSIVDAPVTSTAHFIGPFLSELEKFGTFRPALETLCSKSSHSSAACPGLVHTSNYLESYLRLAMCSATSRMSCDLDEDLTQNLSLQVGSYSYWENAEEIKGDERMEKIDLELRLGRDP